jgi:hypothetical protein
MFMKKAGTGIKRVKEREVDIPEYAEPMEFAGIRGLF